jgi:hypothetical protein
MGRVMFYFAFAIAASAVVVEGIKPAARVPAEALNPTQPTPYRHGDFIP